MPASSLRVEDAVSKGPSTGPPPWNKSDVFVERTHPKVPSVPERPPSDAIKSRSFDRKARQSCESVASCCAPVTKRRLVFGKDWWNSARDENWTGVTLLSCGQFVLSAVVDECGIDPGGIFQSGMYRKNDETR